MTGDKTLAYPLTDEEKALVERYHNLIWKVINDMRLPRQLQDDVYDIAALALMAAARKYQTKDDLREKTTFKTVAYRCIQSAISNELRTRSNYITFSLDHKDDNGRCIYDYTPASEYVPENSPETIKVYNTVVQMLTPRQLTCVIAASNHVTETEYSEMYGCKISCMGNALNRVRKKCFARYCEIFDTDMPEERPIRGHPVTEEERAKILRLFDEGISMAQIGRMLGRSVSVIHRNVKKIRQAKT